jgi:protocatechuate 3,4-dioxygenase beta subunit
MTGRVVAADTGRPVRRARVTVGAGGGASRSALTDDAGRFDVTELAAGRYVVTVAKTGFVTLSFGQRRPRQPPMPLTVGEGQRLEGVDFQLPRGGVITGRVLDETGDAVPGILVRVMRSAYLLGERTLVQAGVDQTDDRGEYRVYGLAPGEYVVSAQPRAEGEGPMRGAFQRMMGGGPPEEVEVPSGYAPTYYPGTTMASDAGRVTLDVSQEVAGIDLALLQVPFARVSGRVTAASGSPPRSGIVALQTEGVTAGPRGALNARLESDGAFSISSVPPGRYRLVARAVPADGDAQLLATQTVTVSGVDVSGLSLALGAGAELAGTVVAEGSGRGAGFDLSEVRVTVRSPGQQQPFGGAAAANPSPEGAFVVRGISAGPQLVTVARLPRGWSLKHVLLGGRDVADAPIDVRGTERMTGAVVVLTDRTTEVSGTVRDSRGNPSVEATVVFFPADSDYWGPASRRISAVRPDQTGQFVARGLPAGDYFVAAVEVVEQGEWFDPQFLEALRSGAQRVSLADGDVKAIDVRTEASSQP